jgi:ribosomal protein S18 acetylase RimI-like enzyme
VIALHELVPDDWDRWRALRLAALAEAPYAFGSRLADWQGDGDAEARWRTRLRDIAYNMVAVLDGEPAGMISGTAGSPVELLSLWVAPCARGRGVGDALVRAVLAWAARRDEATQLAVYEPNARAIALYERHGFVVVGEEPREHGAPRELVMRVERRG